MNAELAAPGVYLDMPFEQYVRDPALSGGKFLKLLTDPGAVQWESPVNPMWEDGHTQQTLRGSALHAAVLEGLDAYEARYALAPEGAMSTGDDMSAWLRKAKVELIDRLPGCDLRVSGSVGELRVRVTAARALLPENERPMFFDEALNGRTLIGSQDDAYVRVLERFVSNEPAFVDHIANGFAEVSIFWVDENGVRRKARPDYLNKTTLLDLKTYGRPPRRDRGLRRHLINEVYYNGYDLQAVNNIAAVRAARGLPIVATGDAATPRIKAFKEMLIATDLRALTFRWLFIRMDGAPTGISIPFRESDGRWQFVEEEISAAIAYYKDYCERCGVDQLWLTCVGEQEIQDMDWPMSAFELRE